MPDEEMNLSVKVNGESKVPPGFRFHPTEEELLHYYLRKKVASQTIDLDVIRDVDLNKLEPWDIQEKCKIGSTPQNDWYFFSHKDKKYPTGTRTNRATAAGFWKATGRDKVIYSSFRRIGMRKTLVFYKGRAPHGQKADWIMHEYRLDDNSITNLDPTASSELCDSTQEDGWVVCRVFKKKNYHKALESPQIPLSVPASMDTRSHELQSLNKDGVLDQLLVYMSCKQETESIVAATTTTTHNNNNNSMQQFMIMNPLVHDDRFFHLPRLDDSPTIALSQSSAYNHKTNYNTDHDHDHEPKEHLDNWADLDRLVASQLNGHMYPCYGEPNDQEDLCFSLDHDDQQQQQQQQLQLCGSSSTSTTTRLNQAPYTSELDLWTFPPSSSSSLPSSSSPDPLCH